MIKKKYIAIFIAVIAFSAMRMPAPNYVLFQDFENGDRTAGGKLNYSNGLVCTDSCMALSEFVARDGKWSIKSQVFAPPTSPCTCGGSIRCETAQLKPDSTEANRYYAVSTFPYNYYTPVRDAQNELIIQFKKAIQGQAITPPLHYGMSPLGQLQNTN